MPEEQSTAPDFNSKDLYEILGVDRKCSDADLKKAYRKLAMLWHPDKNPDDKEQAGENFKKVSGAYTLLSDPTQRSQYDQAEPGSMPSSDGAHRGGGGCGGSWVDPFDLFSQSFGADPWGEYSSFGHE